VIKAVGMRFNVRIGDPILTQMPPQHCRRVAEIAANLTSVQKRSLEQWRIRRVARQLGSQIRLDTSSKPARIACGILANSGRCRAAFDP
jgi:hypothetical protein